MFSFVLSVSEKHKKVTIHILTKQLREKPVIYVSYIEIDNTGKYMLLFIRLRFNKAKYKELHLGLNYSRYVYRMGEYLKSRFAEKDFGILVDEKLDTAPAVSSCSP